MKKIVLVVLSSLIVSNSFFAINYANIDTVYAAKKAVKLSKTKVYFNKLKDIEKITVLNQEKGTTINWSSSNTKVATVNYKGEIKSTGYGKATIYVKIKKDYKVIKTLKCSVEVIGKVTEFKINNKNLSENNTHRILIGEKYDFNRTLKPSYTGLKTYWTVDDADLGIISVDKNGVVTANKPGVVRLVATAAKSKSKIKESKYTDSVIISVIDKKKTNALVEGVKLVSAKQIEVTFDSPIDITTIMNPISKELNDKFRITPNNTKNPNTTKLEALTVERTEDPCKILLNSDKLISGTYDVVISKGVLTIDGVEFTPYIDTFNLTDEKAPYYTKTELNDSGFKNIIYFSEPIDITTLDVKDASLIGGTISNIAKTVLTSKANYVLAKDGKSVIVDLSQLGGSDLNKTYTVMITGIKDIAGNYTNPYIVPVTVSTDTSLKPQARIKSVIRKNISELEVSYTRSINNVGNALLNNKYISGIVSEDDDTKVIYKLSPTEQMLKGLQDFTLSYFNSYNVDFNDKYANERHDFKVNFSVDNDPPYVQKYDLVEKKFINDIIGYDLILKCNEKVKALNSVGYLDAKISWPNGDITSGNRIPYKVVSKDDIVVITFDKNVIDLKNSYDINIPSGFVMDEFENKLIPLTVNINKTGSTSKELPGPTSIVQGTNTNEILITFANKLDISSAENIDNYTVYKKGSIKSAKVIVQNEKESIVKLTLNQGTIPYDGTYPIRIDNVSGYGNSFTSINEFEQSVLLRENVVPKLVSARFVGSNEVRIKFNEPIKGTSDVKVYRGGKLLNSYNISKIVNDEIIITLDYDLIDIQGLYAEIPYDSNSITDINGNVVKNLTVQITR